jgi:CheY-like chemotaxis protein
MGWRREERVAVRLSASVSGLDRHGCAFDQTVETLDISTFGARIAGLKAEVETGSIVNLQHGNRCGRFRVLWTGQHRSAREGQIGLQCVEVSAEVPKPILYITHQDAGHSNRVATLRTAGYTIATANDPRAGWEELRNSNFELIMMDLSLTNGDALPFVNAVRKYYPATQFLMMTANPGRMPETLLTDRDEWLHKGASSNELISRVSELIGYGTRLKWPLARATPRYAVHFPVQMRIFRDGVAAVIEGRSADLSTNGMAVKFKDDLLPGELGTLTFHMPGVEREFRIRVMVRRKNATLCGLEFLETDPADMEAIQDLCAILEPVAAPHEW